MSDQGGNQGIPEPEGAVEKIETDYEIGQNNVEGELWRIGFDIHNPVFVISGLVIIVFVAFALFAADTANALFNGADASDCVGVDAVNGDLNEVPGYCVLREWHRIEREAAIVSGELLVNAVESIVYVTRPPGAGEIRDFETAEVAIQSALTGHLVFSTLHTNDATSAITRLVDMGIPPFLVSSALQ